VEGSALHKKPYPALAPPGGNVGTADVEPYQGSESRHP
jgi:hypothetical protein